MLGHAPQVDRPAVETQLLAVGHEAAQTELLPIRSLRRRERELVAAGILRRPERETFRRKREIALRLSTCQHLHAIAYLVGKTDAARGMHGERLEILRGRHVHVSQAIPRETQFELSVDAACRAEDRAGRQPRDVIAVAEVGIVRDREDDLVCALHENAFRNVQLKRRGEARTKRDKTSVDPDVHLVAHPLERQHGGVRPVKLDRAAVVEASRDVRQRRVVRPTRDRETLTSVQRVVPELVLHPRRVERIEHVLPVAGNGSLDLHALEARVVHALVRIRTVGHLPRAVERHRVVDAVFGHLARERAAGDNAERQVRYDLHLPFASLKKLFATSWSVWSQ